jgi:hypothetical protein
MATPPDFVSGTVLQAASMNAIGLWLVNTTTFSVGTGSVEINDCFSADFQNYKIVWSITPSTTANISVRLRVGGVDNSTSNYFRAGVANLNTGSTLSALNAVSQSEIVLFEGTASEEPFYCGELFVGRPFEVTRTIFNFHNPSRVSGQWGMHVGTALLNQSLSFDGISFIAASGTFTGNLSVYGYRE